jgi:hypothetical protein
MSRNIYYYRTIWSHIVAFSELFEDIKLHIYEKDKNSPNYGEIIGYKKVPVILSPKEKVISALTVQQGKERAEVDNTLPKISVAWNGISWVPERMRGQLQKRNLFVEYLDTSNGQTRVKNFDFQTVPYSLEMEVVLWTKYMDDGVQILENLLPFFAPELYISLKERGVEIERKCMVRLNSITPNFVSELNEPDRRLLQWNLSFTMECNLYKPIYFDKEILVTRISVVDMSKSSSLRAHGDVITTGVSGTLMYGVDPTLISRIAELDQSSSSTAQVSGANYIIDVDTWKSQNKVVFTPTTIPGVGNINITPPEFQATHNPPLQFLWPESRNLSFNHYNSMNPEDPVMPDPTAPIEYEDWNNTLGPPPLQIEP